MDKALPTFHATSRTGGGPGGFFNRGQRLPKRGYLRQERTSRNFYPTLSRQESIVATQTSIRESVAGTERLGERLLKANRYFNVSGFAHTGILYHDGTNCASLLRTARSLRSLRCSAQMVSAAAAAAGGQGQQPPRPTREPPARRAGGERGGRSSLVYFFFSSWF